MARMIDIRLLGSKKLQRKLDKLHSTVAGRVVRESIKDAMDPVRKLAQRRAPVKSGRLRRSIRIASFRGRRNSGLIGAVVRTGTRRQLKIDPTDKYYYPSALEYGTEHIRARSFMRSSLATKKAEVLNSVRINLRRNIEKAGKSG